MKNIFIIFLVGKHFNLGEIIEYIFNIVSENCKSKNAKLKFYKSKINNLNTQLIQKNA